MTSNTLAPTITPQWVSALSGTQAQTVSDRFDALKDSPIFEAACKELDDLGAVEMADATSSFSAVRRAVLARPRSRSSVSLLRAVGYAFLACEHPLDAGAGETVVEPWRAAFEDTDHLLIVPPARNQATEPRGTGLRTHPHIVLYEDLTEPAAGPDGRPTVAAVEALTAEQVERAVAVWNAVPYDDVEDAVDVLRAATGKTPPSPELSAVRSAALRHPVEPVLLDRIVRWAWLAAEHASALTDGQHDLLTVAWRAAFKGQGQA